MCTTITLKTNDGSMIHGRTDEFGMYYRNDIILFPRNYEFGNTMANAAGSNKILTKYAIIGTNIGTLFGEKLSIPELLDDGLNEEGLSMSELYYPGFANYKIVEKVQEDEIDFTILGRNVLAECKNIEEVIAYVEKYQGKFVAQANIPVHFMFADKSGKTLVVEPDVPGNATVYVKNNGIMTNAPKYEFHLLNLNQYVNLQQIDGNVDSAIKGVDGNNLFAHGTAGAFGLPGDTSPASRFVKASYLRDTTTKKDLNTADEGVLRMIRILNNFDIVPGMSLKRINAGLGEGGVGENANPVDYEGVSSGHTDHTDIKDLTNGRYFYTTQDNQAPRYVEFSDYDLDAKDIVRITMEKDDSINFQKIIMK